MPLYRSEALVLRGMNLGDADRLLTFFTEERGKIRAVAKGVRRTKSKFGGSLEPLTCVHLVYFGKENADLYRVNSADIVRSFDGLRTDLEKWTHSLFLAELIDKLLKEREALPPLYRLALTLLGEIEADGRTEEHLILFQARLLSAVGYRPNLSRCVHCGGDLFEKGGALAAGGQGISCLDCSPGPFGSRLSPGSLRYLDRATTLDTEKAMRLSIPKSLRGEIQRFLLAYVTDLSGVRLKVPQFFDL